MSASALYIVDNTNSSLYPLTYGFHRFTLYASSLTWVFYLTDNTDQFYFKSSYDNYASATAICNASYVLTSPEASLFDVATNGSDISWVFMNGTAAVGWYRRGVAYSNGTIGWYADVQQFTVTGGSAYSDYYPSITISSNGSDFMGWRAVSLTFKYLRASFNAYTNGSCVLNTAFNIVQNSAAPHGLEVIVRSGLNNWQYALYNSNESSAGALMKCFNGSSGAWNTTAITVESDFCNLQNADFKNNGDYLQFVYTNTTGTVPTYDLLFTCAVRNGAWTTPYKIASPDVSLLGAYFSGSLCLNQSGVNESWVFYYKSTYFGSYTHVDYAHRFENDTWQVDQRFVNLTSSTYLYLTNQIHAGENIQNNQIAVMFPTNQTTPYDVLLGYLSFTVANPTLLLDLTGTFSFSYDQSFFLKLFVASPYSLTNAYLFSLSRNSLIGLSLAATLTLGNILVPILKIANAYVQTQSFLSSLFAPLSLTFLDVASFVFSFPLGTIADYGFIVAVIFMFALIASLVFFGFRRKKRG